MSIARQMRRYLKKKAAIDFKNKGGAKLTTLVTAIDALRSFLKINASIEWKGWTS